MCTVSWLFEREGYELFFNRDESVRRGAGEPPAVRVRNGVRFLTPTDSDAGGSWLAVNELGLSLAIANYYEDGYPRAPRPPAGEFVSRGLLLVSLADEADQRAIGRRLGTEPLPRYRPFTLIAFEPGKTVATFTWDGKDLLFDGAARCPIATSALRADEVLASRERLLGRMTEEKGRLDAELLEAFHRSHLPEKGPLSVCMHRPEARTVSLSRVSVGPRRVSFRYAPGSACETPFMPAVALARAARTARPDTK